MRASRGGDVNVTWALRVWAESRYDSRYRPSTVRIYRRACKMAEARFGTEIPTTGEVEAWVNSMLSEGRSPQTCNLYLKSLAAVLSEAALVSGSVEAHRLADRVTAARVLKTGQRAPRCPETRDVRRACEAEELSAAERALVRMCAICGLRIGEAMALRWDDISESGVVRVTKSVDVETMEEGPRKNKHDHVVRLDEKTLGLIGGLDRKGERIWSGESQNSLRLTMRKIREICASIRSWHMLRHWGAYVVAERTQSTQRVQEFLGDRSSNAAQMYMPALRGTTSCDARDIARELER